jgi:hypothetical protein
MKKKVSKPSKETIERRKAKAAYNKKLAAAGKKAKIARDKRNKKPQSGVGSPAAEASIGNRWWLHRSKHGRDKLFSSPELLWQAAVEYFEYTIHTPMGYKIDFKNTKNGLKEIRIPYTPVLTMEGFCLYAGCSKDYFSTFTTTISKTDPKRHDFLRVVEAIRKTIYNNKYSGAANGSLNASLIAYDLKLRSDISSSTSVGMNITVNNNKENDLLDKVLAKLKAVDDEPKE